MQLGLRKIWKNRFNCEYIEYLISAIETQNIIILKAVSAVAFGNVIYMSSQMSYFGRRSNFYLFIYFNLW